MDPVATHYLENIRKLYRYYKSLGDKALAQVEEKDLHRQPNEASNSIAVIVKHLAGNMRSRWTDFLTTDGEKPWRDRDGEFEADYPDRQALLDDWESGWQCLFGAIDTLTAEHVMQTVYIRNEGHTVLEAVNRQLTHVPYHIGQLVYVARMLANDSWESLSIPKNASKAYNERKFNEEKGDRFFTDRV